MYSGEWWFVCTDFCIFSFSRKAEVPCNNRIDEASTLAKAMETAECWAKDLKALLLAVNAIPTNEPPTKRTNSQQEQPFNSYNCYHCGGKHSFAKCRFREFDCNYCGKKVTQLKFVSLKLGIKSILKGRRNPYIK